MYNTHTPKHSPPHTHTINSRHSLSLMLAFIHIANSFVCVWYCCPVGTPNCVHSSLPSRWLEVMLKSSEVTCYSIHFVQGISSTDSKTASKHDAHTTMLHISTVFLFIYIVAKQLNDFLA